MERRAPIVVCLADVSLVVHEAEVKSFRGLAGSQCLTQTLAISLGVRQDKAQQPVDPTQTEPEQQAL